jgi:long-chain fatty acid transport protein
MILRNNKKALASALVLSILGGKSALAAGFEKSILWSGKYAGQGGAAVSSATGAEALFFNPAGLAGSKGTDVSVNVSPTFSKFAGPVVTANSSVDGQQTFSPIFGALASYAINEKFGIGVGAYVAGGATADMGSITAGGGTHNPKTDLSIMEYSIGAGYEVIPGLKLGAAYRINQINANLTFMSGTNSVSLKDLKDTKTSGFRAGLTYEGAGWALGAGYRNGVDFTAEGTAASIVGGTAYTGSAATAATTLPAAWNVGGRYDVNSEWSIIGEYSRTSYSKVDKIRLTGTTGPSGVLNLADTPVALNWDDQNVIRGGLTYSGMAGWTWRAGGSLTSVVTNPAYARSTLTPPGKAYSFTAGFTTGLTSAIDLSAAGEYTMAKGTATGLLAGDYSANGYMLHTGVNYRF